MAEVNNPSAPPTKELYVPVTGGSGTLTDAGDFPVIDCYNGGMDALMAFKVPEDFNSIIEAIIIVIPRFTIAAANWNIYSDYANIGEIFDTDSETDTLTMYNVLADRLFGVDVSGILTNLDNHDVVGLRIVNQDSAHDFRAIGFRLRYA